MNWPALGATASVDGGQRSWNRAALRKEIARLARSLEKRGTKAFATLMDNGPAWVVADLAATRQAIVHVPLPLFFSAEQVSHALHAAGIDTLLASPQAAANWPQAAVETCVVAGEACVLVSLPGRPVAMPGETAKITFTSGSTGAPKGVCLDAGALDGVVSGVAQALEPLAIRRHLCALPFAVLLENVAGLLAPLSQGATCIVPPLSELGLTGSSRFDAARFHAAVERYRPDSIILLPQMLRLWIAHLDSKGLRAPGSLKFVAVGGSAVGARTLLAARALGIPAYEGYGLSEGASVQSLNLPGADVPGSAGRALPHARLRVAADGEIEIAGSLFAGYLGGPRRAAAWWPTGDLGSIDAAGFVHVQGRKKQVLITAFGRNVSPEWVEAALGQEPGIAQAAVFGDGLPELIAVLWPSRAGVSDAALQRAVAAANEGLPDYARIGRWVKAVAPFTADAGMSTANGRLQRAAIWRAHAPLLPAQANQPELSCVSMLD